MATTARRWQRRGWTGRLHVDHTEGQLAYIVGNRRLRTSTPPCRSGGACSCRDLNAAPSRAPPIAPPRGVGGAVTETVLGDRRQFVGSILTLQGKGFRLLLTGVVMRRYVMIVENSMRTANVS